MEWFWSLCSDHQLAIVCVMLAACLIAYVLISNAIEKRKARKNRFAEYWMCEEERK